MPNKKNKKKSVDVSASPVPVPNTQASGNPMINMSFSRAIESLIGGKKIRRAEWSDEQEYCLLENNYLSIHRNGKFHAWIISEGDLMAKDWMVI